MSYQRYFSYLIALSILNYPFNFHFPLTGAIRPGIFHDFVICMESFSLQGNCWQTLGIPQHKNRAAKLQVMFGSDQSQKLQTPISFLHDGGSLLSLIIKTVEITEKTQDANGGWGMIIIMLRVTVSQQVLSQKQRNCFVLH